MNRSVAILLCLLSFPAWSGLPSTTLGMVKECPTAPQDSDLMAACYGFILGMIEQVSANEEKPCSLTSTQMEFLFVYIFKKLGEAPKDLKRHGRELNFTSARDLMTTIAHFSTVIECRGMRFSE